jgi:hypothetical protein
MLSEHHNTNKNNSLYVAISSTQPLSFDLLEAPNGTLNKTKIVGSFKVYISVNYDINKYAKV